MTMHTALPFFVWLGLGLIGWVLMCLAHESSVKRTWADEGLTRDPSSVWADPVAYLMLPLSLVIGPFAILVALMSGLLES